MNKKNMLKGFIVAAIMLALGTIIVLANSGPEGLVSSFGTALATLGMNRAFSAFARRNATGPVTSIRAASVENDTMTFYKR